MKITKIKNGEYNFKGIDSYNGEIISGVIIYQPFDKPLNQAWEVRFGNVTPFRGKSLKDCKNWLTY